MMEIIEKNIYQSPVCGPYLERLTGISPGFKNTIHQWVIGGNIVEITKDRYDNCLKYDFKINKSEPPRLGQLVIVDVY